MITSTIMSMIIYMIKEYGFVGEYFFIKYVDDNDCDYDYDYCEYDYDNDFVNECDYDF